MLKKCKLVHSHVLVVAWGKRTVSVRVHILLNEPNLKVCNLKYLALLSLDKIGKMVKIQFIPLLVVECLLSA